MYLFILLFPRNAQYILGMCASIRKFFHASMFISIMHLLEKYHHILQKHGIYEKMNCVCSLGRPLSSDAEVIAAVEIWLDKITS